MWIKVLLVVSIAFFAVQAKNRTGSSTPNPNPRRPPNVEYTKAGAIPRTKPAGPRSNAVIEWLDNNFKQVSLAIQNNLGLDPDPTKTLFQAGGYRIDLQGVHEDNGNNVQRFALQKGKDVLGQVHLQNWPAVATSVERNQLNPRTVSTWLTNGLYESLKDGHIWHVTHNPWQQPATTPTPRRG